MKMIPNSGKHRYAARVTIFLITVALIAGTIGCAPIVWYNLTVSSTEGGKVVAPGEGTFSCSGRRGVILLVASDTGYHFVGWTGDVSNVADVNSTATTITMCGDCSIKANFERSVGGGCFVATAAYGTPMAEEVQVLREFRDEYLLTSPLGQRLVDVYYTISPPIADLIAEHPSLKPIVRAGLVPVVTMCSMLIDSVSQFAGNGA